MHTQKRLSLSPRLKSKTLIDKLFTSKHSKAYTVYPIRMVCLDVDMEHDAVGNKREDSCPVRVLFSVSKRHFKHAVDRNRIKRQMREAYRHCRAEHEESSRDMQEQGMQTTGITNTVRLIAFVWLADKHFESKKVTHAIRKVLGKLH